MNADKRRHSSLIRGQVNGDLIIISSSDEEPPRKKQKSLTPVLNNAAPSAVKPTTPITNDANSKVPNGTNATSTKKPSPWKNRPSWQKITSTSPETRVIPLSFSKSTGQGQQKQINKSDRKPSNDWTVTDNNLLRKLSIAHDSLQHATNRSAATAKPPTNEKEREQEVSQFKLGHSDPLRFNPNNGNQIRTNTINNIRGHKLGQPRSSEVARYLPSHRGSPASSSSEVPKKQNATAGSNVKVKEPAKGAEIRHPPVPASSSSVRLSSTTSHLSHRSPELVVNVPLTDVAKLKQVRQRLQEKLKQGVDYAKEHPEEVEKCLSLTGFSPNPPANLDEEKFKRAAQPKKRMVDRNKLTIDIYRAGPVQPLPSPSPNSQLVHPRDQVQAILTARFGERFGAPLMFSNSLNDRILDGKFQFVSDYIQRKGVKDVGPIGQPRCTCVSDCQEMCACVHRRFQDAGNKKNGWFEYVPQYERRPDGLVVLRDDFIKRHMIYALTDSNKAADISDSPSRVEISECDKQCRCGPSCINQVVQRGRKVPLEIFETAGTGFGVRSSVNLARGQFIEVYLGEVITNKELDRREAAAEAGSTSYIYSLDWFPNNNQPYHIDGENFGSAMRFVNHSCDPNTGTFPVLNNEKSKQLHYVAFFALKHIPAGTEITIDYTPQAAGEVYELKAADDGMEKCHCGARNCRQMLWPPGSKQRRRKKVVGTDLD